MHDEILNVCRLIKEKGGEAYLVGGCVRDWVLGLQPKDFDIEVYHIAPDELVRILSERYQVDLVGKSFGVLKLKGLPIDVSIPRVESAMGIGHRDFDVICDPNMPFYDAAVRRDFTINAVMYKPFNKAYMDPTGRGLHDIEYRVLRPVSEKFKEDPLRVLRGVQFAARFNLAPEETFYNYSRELAINGLSKERLFEEWNKFLLKGEFLSNGLNVLKLSTWLRFFPELAHIQNVPQDPEHHPEGDVYTHTGFVLDAFAKDRTGNDHEDLVMGYAALCHDFGKATHTQWNEEKKRYTAYGHEEAGEIPTRTFMARLTNQQELIEDIVVLVKHHLKPRLYYKAKAGKPAIRRLALEVKRLDRLVQLNKLDQLGRPPLDPTEFPEVNRLMSIAKDLNVEKSGPAPIIMGRHLVAMGMKPGPDVGRVLKACFEAQLDGKFTSEAEGIEFAKSVITREQIKIVVPLYCASDLADG